jgi:hypothetical protein
VSPEIDKTMKKRLVLVPPLAEITNPKKGYVGGQITGRCIPASTTITSIDSDTEIEISNDATCSGIVKLTATSTIVEPPQPAVHTLSVNKLLSNQWLWNPKRRPRRALYWEITARRIFI